MPANVYEVLGSICDSSKRSGWVSRTGVFHEGENPNAPVSASVRWLKYEPIPAPYIRYLLSGNLLRMLKRKVCLMNEFVFRSKAGGEHRSVALHITLEANRKYSKVFGRLSHAMFSHKAEGGIAVYYVHYLDPASQVKIESFLRNAGVHLEEYTPPWLEPKEEAYSTLVL